MIQGTEPTKVLLQWRTIRLSVSAKTNEDSTFFPEMDSAYMCAAMAIGATHHFPTGSKAAESKAPDSAESRSATNPKH